MRSSPACRRLGLSFMPYFPLASGMLTGKYRRGEPPPPGTRMAGRDGWDEFLTDERFDVVERLSAFAQEHGHTILELAMSWLAVQPEIATVIAGATSAEQVRENAAAVDAWKLSEDELAEIDDLLAWISTRPRDREDARAIAEVHVASWRHAYRGLLPDDYLDRLSVEEREKQRREHLEDPSSEWGTLVADDAGRVVGFSTYGPSRDDDATDATGEVPAIYLDPDVVGTGVGRELFAETVVALRAAGFTRASLWVLEGNVRARRFYEKAGWRWDGTVSQHDFDCANRPVVRYATDL